MVRIRGVGARHRPVRVARPLRRAIEHHLEDALSEAMLRGEFVGRKKVLVTVQPAAESEKASLKLECVGEDERQPEPVGAVADST